MRAALLAALALAVPAAAEDGGSSANAPVVPAPAIDASDAIAPAIVPPAIAPEAAPAFTLDVMGEDHLLTSRLGSALVFDANGREIGDVEDVVVGGDGSVVALLIGLGGTLGLGEKPVAVRFEHVALERNDEGEPRFVLDLEGAALRDAPAFDAPEG